MIALQWQDKVLSLLDQSKYPQDHLLHRGGNCRGPLLRRYSG